MMIPFSYAYYVIDLDSYAFGCNPGCFNIDHFSVFHSQFMFMLSSSVVLWISNSRRELNVDKFIWLWLDFFSRLHFLICKNNISSKLKPFHFILLIKNLSGKIVLSCVVVLFFFKQGYWGREVKFYLNVAFPCGDNSTTSSGYSPGPGR